MGTKLDSNLSVTQGPSRCHFYQTVLCLSEFDKIHCNFQREECMFGMFDEHCVINNRGLRKSPPWTMCMWLEKNKHRALCVINCYVDMCEIPF